MSRVLSSFKYKSSVFMKTFLSYLVIFIIPLFLIGAMCYYWAVSTVKKQVETNCLNIVENVKDDTDNNLISLNKFAVQLNNISWINNIAKLKDDHIDYLNVGPEAINTCKTELSSFKALNDFLEDIAIYFNGKNTLFSTQSLDSLESFFGQAYRFDGISPSDWKETLSHRNTARLMLPMKVTSAYRWPDKQLFTYLYSLPVSSSDPRATLIVFINEKRLVRSLDSLPENNLFYILDSNNRYIAGKNVPETERQYFAGVELAGASGTLETVKPFPDGVERNIYYETSGYNGWKFVYSIPKTVTVKQINNIKVLTILLSLLSVLAGLLISYRLTLFNYRPLENIVDVIRSKLFRGSVPGPDEYGFVEEMVNKMVENKYEAENKLSFFKAVSKDFYLHKLLIAPIDENTCAELADICDITFGSDYFTCLAVLSNSGDSYTADIRNDISSMAQTRQALAYLVEINEKHKAVILNTVDEAQAGQLTELIGKQLVRAYNFKSVGIGRTFKGLNKLNQSFVEASIAVDYRFIKWDEGIIYYSSIEEFNNSFYYYPMEKEEHLLNNIMCGDYTSSVNLVKEITDINISVRKLSSEAMRHLFYEFAVTGLKAAEDLRIPRDSFSSQFDNLLCSDTTYEMMECLRALYGQICSIITQAKESHNLKLRDEILEYIAKNFSNSNLSLSHIANEFSISPAYLSRFIKDQTGINFIDYLNRYRINAAKRLLKSNEAVMDAAKKAGFDNDITFRRIFKKYEGIAPSQFKQQQLAYEANGK